PGRPRSSMELMAGLREMPNVHMIAVHFPIALLPVAVVLDVLGWVTGSRDLHVAARWALWLGTVGAAVAVWSGYSGSQHVHRYVTDAAEELMEDHEHVQLGTLGAALGLSLWRLVTRGPFPERGRFVYLLLAVAMVVNLVVASDLGGQMVFLHGVAVHVDADSLQGSAEKAHDGE